MNRSFTVPKSRVNQCPLCQGGIQIQPTSIFGDFVCRACGRTLWFLAASNSARFFEHAQAKPIRDYVIDFIAERIEVDPLALAENPELLNSHDTDSLERLEMLMELEDELEIV